MIDVNNIFPKFGNDIDTPIRGVIPHSREPLSYFSFDIYHLILKEK
jgi:hypothetical protein